MENQPSRIPWFRLATMGRLPDPEAQSQPEPAQPAQPPAPTAATQPALPVIRVPQPRAPAPLPPAPAPAPQPIIRPPVPTPTAQPSQPTLSRQITPPIQQDVPKPPVPTSNGAAASVAAPSPPPSPKVIKTSTPTPPPSPRVTPAPQIPPMHPEAETKPAPELSRLKTIAMQEDKGYKGNGNGSNDKTNGKTNGGAYNNNGVSKISNGSNDKTTSNNGTNLAPQPERKEIENGRGMFEGRAKPQYSNSGMAPPNSNHKKSEKDLRVITIAGENIGALMELGHNVHGYSRKMQQGGNSLTSGSGTQDKKATDSTENKGMAPAKPMTSLVNSNVQSINNSMLFNSTCTQKSPGVHLSFKSMRKGKAHKPSSDSTSS